MKKQVVIPSPTPATYIQANSATFKDLVQKLTGVSAHKLRPEAAVYRRSPFKLQDRRKHSVRDIQIIKMTGKTQSNASSSPIMKGPTTPLGDDSVFCDRVGTESPPSEEERAIADKGFYLHASPVKEEPPLLLTLFPLTSPNHEF